MLACNGHGSPIVINEFLSSNGSVRADEEGDFEDWIELYNTTSEPINLDGYWLSNDESDPYRWRLPAATIWPEDFLLVWASGKDRSYADRHLHTNFRISREGTTLLLSDPDGVLIDIVPPVELRRDVSYGRKPDGTDNWFVFAEPTPFAPNSTEGFMGILAPPVFSGQGGLYTEGFHLSLENTMQGSAIYYTLDGSVPDPDNIDGTTYSYKLNYPWQPGDPVGDFHYTSFHTMLYEAPIEIRDRSEEPDRLTGIATTHNRNSDHYAPLSPVFKGTMVRVMAVKDGFLPSDVETHTYFVTPEGGSRYSLPVVSVGIQEDYLFDYERGIYVAGKLFDEWRAAHPSNPPSGGSPANYHNRGREWEYPAHLEVFDTSRGRALSRNTGLRIHGGTSRSVPQKSIRFYARMDYDTENTIDYPFFPGLTDRVWGEPRESFRRILFRNSGSESHRTRIRDATATAVLHPLNVDHQAYFPVVHFINGEYWGLLNARERIDRFYIAGNYRIEPEDVAIINRHNNLMEGDPEDLADWLDLYAYIAANDMVDPIAFAYVEDRIAIQSYINYQIGQIYIKNTDWPGNNLRHWRSKKPDRSPAAPPGHDGRWRWILFDLDAALGNYFDTTVSHDTLAFAAEPGGTQWPNPDWSTLVFRKLLENSAFRERFIISFADHINSSFQPRRIDAIIDEIHGRIAPYLPEHHARWRNHSNTSPQFMRDFAHQRPGYVKQHIINFFDLAGVAELTLDTPEALRGSFRLNTIMVDSGTPGLENPDDPYPWTGVYFQGVPVEVQALPAPGYRFAGWENYESSSPLLTLDLTGDLSLTALFEEREEPALVHYWNFNNSTNMLEPTRTIGGADLTVTPGPATEIEAGDGNGFAGENARLGEGAGDHLRVNNPLGAELYLSLPTSGYEEIVLKYETRRSGQGAGLQAVEYTTNGSGYTLYDVITVHDDHPVLHTFDFITIPEADNNPDFGVRITFGQGQGAEAGNNRFDNLTVEGVPLEGTVLPPVVEQQIAFRKMIEEAGPETVGLSQHFSHPQGEPLVYSASSTAPGIVGVSVSEDTLTLTPLLRGDANIVVTAADGHNTPVAASFRVLVYPKPHVLSEGNFAFTEWAADTPEGVYPEHMLFLQSDVSDPGLDTPLLHPYFIPHDDYNEEDLDTLGYPYNNTRRTRLSGLGQNGIAFINTGRGRDLGGALVALDTRGMDEVEITWLGGTILRNSRVYGIRLKYRTHIEYPFQTLLFDGHRQKYLAGQDGDTTIFGPLALPEELLDQDYLQLLWRYHHVGIPGGPRPKLRLDDIVVGTDVMAGKKVMWVLH